MSDIRLYNIWKYLSKTRPDKYGIEWTEGKWYALALVCYRKSGGYYLGRVNKITMKR